MIINRIYRLGSVVLGIWIALGSGVVQANQTFSLVYLQRAADPHYQPHRAYTGLKLRDRHRPVDGARVAIRDGRILGRALDIKFELVEETLEAQVDATAAVRTMLENNGVHVFLVDLPLDDMQRLATAFAGQNIILFNIRHSDDQLRGTGCSPAVFHTIPSDAMLMDTLAQFLVKKNWKKVLVLESENPDDRRLSTSFQRAARKFGLDITDIRPYVLGHDPRQRDQNNIGLLTSGSDYDVIFLTDTDGEFGRYLPYNSQRPRPIVGSEGLTPSAWHWTWERHGAPQLNQRFIKHAQRPMQAADYAAWAAVKSVLEAVTRTQSTDTATLREYLGSEQFVLDTYKGVPGSFRSWNQQLRQSILLYRHNAVIARAPIDGFLHQTNNLDTLGSDRPESTCEF